jgi:acyl-CoA thioesterase-2
METMGLPGLLTLERVEDNLFRTVVADEEPVSPYDGLYGGLVAAQALRAASATVASDRHPHSLHGYFLGRGDASRPVLLTVHRDRDGGHYSNRRVIAAQDSAVIFNMIASFHVSEPGQDYQAHQIPQVARPDELPDKRMTTRLRGMDIRVPEQPDPGQRRPSRIWLRSRHPLPDDVMQACALTYVSDIFSGLRRVPGATDSWPFLSIDHAIWIYRKNAFDDWVLLDLQPESTFGGRGMYTGQIFASDGALAAGIAQESLFRPRLNGVSQASQPPAARSAAAQR